MSSTTTLRAVRYIAFFPAMQPARCSHATCAWLHLAVRLDWGERGSGGSWAVLHPTAPCCRVSSSPPPPPPHIHQAGKSSLTKELGTAACLTFEERPPTPEREKKWRGIQEPGARIRHPGLVRAGVLGWRLEAGCAWCPLRVPSGLRAPPPVPVPVGPAASPPTHCHWLRHTGAMVHLLQCSGVVGGRAWAGLGGLKGVRRALGTPCGTRR
jgi:hypothetical protein